MDLLLLLLLVYGIPICFLGAAVWLFFKFFKIIAKAFLIGLLTLFVFSLLLAAL